MLPTPPVATITLGHTGDQRHHTTAPPLLCTPARAVAQVAHAAVLAAAGGGVEAWGAAACPGRGLAPSGEVFAAVADSNAVRGGAGRDEGGTLSGEGG